MRKFLLAGAAAATALFATPVFAQTNAGFIGPRVELQGGVRDANVADSEATYGLALGADTAISDRLTLGIEVSGTNVFDETGRTLEGGVRAGYAITPNVLAFVRGGYANVDAGVTHLDGVAAGGGLQFRLPRNTYLSTEYRYTNYELGVDSHAGLLGLGIRF